MNENGKATGSKWTEEAIREKFNDFLTRGKESAASGLVGSDFGLTLRKICDRADPSYIKDDKLKFNMVRHRSAGRYHLKGTAMPAFFERVVTYSYDPETDSISEADEAEEKLVIKNLNGLADSICEGLYVDITRIDQKTFLVEDPTGKTKKRVCSYEEACEFVSSIVNDWNLSEGYFGGAIPDDLLLTVRTECDKVMRDKLQEKWTACLSSK